jgi:Tol biopolymer transport system component
MNGSSYQWTRDSSAVTFVREENGHVDLWLQPRDGSAARRLTNFTEGSIADFAWSRDGKRAVLSHVVEAVDVVVIR